MFVVQKSVNYVVRKDKKKIRLWARSPLVFLPVVLFVWNHADLLAFEVSLQLLYPLFFC